MKGKGTPDPPSSDHLLYAALLDRAHKAGLRRISTRLLQAPNEHNRFVAIVMAQVETQAGTFDGIGDASLQNVSGAASTHLIRMAETRAKARALRDAVNLGDARLEADYRRPDRVPDPSTWGPTATPTATSLGPPPSKPGQPRPATPHQLDTIARLCRLTGRQPPTSERLSSAEASDLISQLSKAFHDGQSSGSQT